MMVPAEVVINGERIGVIELLIIVILILIALYVAVRVIR
jgi:hypothetical protein